jgi:hypothetical protein
MEVSKVGSQIGALRKACGLRCADLAARVGIHQGHARLSARRALVKAGKRRARGLPGWKRPPHAQSRPRPHRCELMG